MLFKNKETNSLVGLRFNSVETRGPGGIKRTQFLAEYILRGYQFQETNLMVTDSFLHFTIKRCHIFHHIIDHHPFNP